MSETSQKFPKITVVVVTYNAGEKLKSTIDSAMQQTYTNVEILVKDGLSQDGSTSFLSEEPYASGVRFFSEKDGGIYEAMNRAVDLATGDYLVFINSGDSLHSKTSLAEAAKHIVADNFQNDIYYGDNFTCNRNSVTYSPKKLTNYVCFCGVIGHQTMLYSSKVFDKVKYDLRFRICACITHYIVAFKRYRMKFKYIPVVISNYEGGGVSDCAEGRRMSIRDRRVCLREEYGLQYYWYTFLTIITLKRLKQDLSSARWFEPMYRKLTMLIKGNKG